MSAALGVNKTLVDTGGMSKIAQGLVDGRVKVMSDSYEASGLTTSSTIQMGQILPAGARVCGYQLAYDAISTVSLALGDTASGGSARYLASVDTANTAGVKNDILVDGLDYVIGTASGDNQILVSTTGVSAATGTIKVKIFYTTN